MICDCNRVLKTSRQRAIDGDRCPTVVQHSNLRATHMTDEFTYHAESVPFNIILNRMANVGSSISNTGLLDTLGQVTFLVGLSYC